MTRDRSKTPPKPAEDAADAGSVSRLRVAPAQRDMSSGSLPRILAAEPLPTPGAQSVPRMPVAEPRRSMSNPSMPRIQVAEPQRSDGSASVPRMPVAEPRRSMSNPSMPRIQVAEPQRSMSNPSMASVKLPVSQPSPSISGAPKYPLKAVIIAASTGGPAAITALFAALPEVLTAPVLVVQHMNREFLASFVARLAQQSRQQVRVAQGRELVYPGQVWFAPGGRHLLTEPFGKGFRLRLTDSPPVNGCRPSADETIASAVSTLDGHVLAVVLSGIGRDGRDGCRLVRAARGHVLVQDSNTADVAEMPEAVAKEQLAEGAFSPAELGVRIARKLAYGR